MIRSNGNTAIYRESSVFKLGKIKYRPLIYILKSMRKEDMVELFATTNDENINAIAKQIMQSHKSGFIVFNNNNEPVAVFWGVELWSSLLMVGMIATDKWQYLSLGVTKYLKKVWDIRLLKSNYKQQMCFVLSSNNKAISWLEFLGFKQESYLNNFGKYGENFYLMRKIMRL